jgi:hypothetical protein
MSRRARAEPETGAARGTAGVVPDPARVHVQRPRAVRQHRGRDRARERFAGHDDRLRGRLERGAPALPLAGGVGGRRGDREARAPSWARAGARERPRVCVVAHMWPASRPDRPGARCAHDLALAPAALSIALPTSELLGKPDPYSHVIVSRISNPASSTATARRWAVRVPPNASRCPPGLSTRRHSVQTSTGTAWSQARPMNASPYGRVGDDGVHRAAAGRVGSTARLSPWPRLRRRVQHPRLRLVPLMQRDDAVQQPAGAVPGVDHLNMPELICPAARDGDSRPRTLRVGVHREHHRVLNLRPRIRQRRPRGGGDHLVHRRVKPNPQPLPREAEVVHRGPLGLDELLTNPDPHRRVGLRPHLRVVQVRARSGGPLKERQPTGLLARQAALTDPPQLVRGLHARRRRVPNLGVRAGRQRRQHRRHTIRVQVVRLIENDGVRGEPTTRTPRPGHEPQPAAVDELDAFLAVRGPDLLDPLPQPRCALHMRQDPQEPLLRCLELMRAVEDQVLLEQEQPGQLPRLEQRALAVLPRYEDANLEAGPAVVAPLA